MSELKKADFVGMEIKNISLKKYLELNYKFKYLQAYEYINPENLINGKSCITEELTFNEVKTIALLYRDSDIDKIKMLFSICFKEENLLTCGVLEFFRSKKWLDNEIDEILKREKALLSRPPDPRQIAAGSGDLNRYGSANTTVNLGAQFGFRPRDIGNWLYTEVLIIQAINVTTGEIQRNLARQKK